MSDAEEHPAEEAPRSLIGRIVALFLGPGESEPGREVLKLLFFVWGMIFIGLLSLAAPALSLIVQDQWSQALSLVGVGLFIAGAATASGSMLGFLFGVPKSNPESVHGQPQDSEEEPPYVANTNLETISDWLTKVIVGVGLVEIRSVITWLDQVGQTAGAAMGDGQALRVIATALLIHNLLMGFFQGFLVAYLYLPKVFSASRSVARRTK